MTAEFVWIKYTAPVSAKLSFKFALSFSMKLEAVSNRLNIWISNKELYLIMASVEIRN